MEILIR